jgi:hypothetical protein
MTNGGIGVSELSDVELLASTRALIGRSNQVLAALLAHLGEVEARGLHRTRACSSLYAYCIYELRLSEDEAVRRVAAARMVRKFPELLDAVAAGELHLTGLLMVGPHLTRELRRSLGARQTPDQERARQARAPPRSAARGSGAYRSTGSGPAGHSSVQPDLGRAGRIILSGTGAAPGRSTERLGRARRVIRAGA